MVFEPQGERRRSAIMAEEALLPHEDNSSLPHREKEVSMRWRKPKVKEVCVGLEINDYFPAVL
jgi:coenzyme PQQ precursor peptide PqqA